jgi:hypothetical protein
MIFKAILSLSGMALMVGVACYAQVPPEEPKLVSAAIEEGDSKLDTQSTESNSTTSDAVVVQGTGLYGDWKMVLSNWQGSDKPVIGDFCNFKKRDQGVSVICADGFLQATPVVTLNEDKLRLRWGGPLTNTIYEAVLVRNGFFDGEIIQVSWGMVNNRFKTKMERVFNQPAKDVPKDSLTVLNNYFDDLASKSIREKYYVDSLYKSMKKAVVTPAYADEKFTVKYFGQLLHQTAGRPPTFPDVFKVANAENAEKWCLVRVDAEGLADVRCRAIP